MSSAPHRVFRLLILIWVGSALTIGYVVAPTLFTTLERAMAGDVAARLFRIEAFLGVACGILSLALGNMLVRRGAAGYRRLRWLVVGMLLCVLIGYFGLQPFMDALRESARAAGLDLAHSQYAARFGLLHGIATLFYVVETLLGLALVWMLPAGTPAQGAERQAGVTA
ncbi:DUF4149 domain-containing protein [Trinickia dinghuensis]|uniref:DUF4149 domain-containing protein n=1 Tax=Trinickia dinghuensis TaxID=2291023 RepID=A0A3D8JSH3_9BURK|nr:DUF4149 domain-containing protein [Trinickia dinghuensis]RDU95626.1 DUF4149 domain-containing protein [Trinickia dinghuensis]